jgi:uncharacterized protein YhfF
LLILAAPHKAPLGIASEIPHHLPQESERSVAFMPQHILISDGPAQPNPADIDAFWDRARELHADLGDDYQVRSLGIDADTTEQILEFIKTREKIATFSLPWVMAANDFPPSSPGIPVVLCDYEGNPRLIVRLTEVRETTFGEITLAETSLDGPPVQDPEIWIPLHRTYWNGLLAAYGRECTDEMPVLIEPFDYIGEVI